MSLPRAITQVYVAGPLGFTVPTRSFYNDTLLPAITAIGVEVLDPWKASEEAFRTAFAHDDAQTRARAVREANQSAGAANERMIRQCDALFAVLDGPDVDSGTAAEIGFAAALGKPVIGWRSDLRQTGDNSETPVNLQVEHFVRANGGDVYTDLRAACEALTLLTKPRSAEGGGT